MDKKKEKTRLSSIESQPKKVVVVVVVVGLVVVFGVPVFGFVVFGGVVVTFVGHINLTLKFGQKWVNDKRYIVIVVVLVLVAVIVLVLLVLSLF